MRLITRPNEHLIHAIKYKAMVLLSCALILCFFTCLSSADENIIHLTTGDWPPYTSPDLEHFGSLSQIVSEAFALEGYVVNYGFFPWARSYELAKSGSWDGSVGWSPTPERKQFFYTSVPVQHSRKVFFHRKDTDFNWENPSDLKGLKIGVSRGYRLPPFLESEEAKNDVTIITSDSDEQNLRHLLNNRIDIFDCNIDVGHYLIKTRFTPEEARALTHHPKVTVNHPLSVIFPKTSPESKNLLDTFNRGLARLKQTGRYAHLTGVSDRQVTLKVGMSEWPPWKIVENGKYSGIDVVILNELGKRAGVTFQYAELPWQRCVEMVRNGEIDIITNFSWSPEREKFAYFFKPAYSAGRVVFYRKKNSRVRLSKYKDLYKYKVGTIKGSLYFPKFDEDSKIQKEPVAYENQLIQMLTSERIDLMAGWEVSMTYMIATSGQSSAVEKLPFREGDIPYFIAMSKKSELIRYRRILNKELGNMIKNNDIQTIINIFLKSEPQVKSDR